LETNRLINRMWRNAHGGFRPCTAGICLHRCSIKTIFRPGQDIDFDAACNVAPRAGLEELAEEIYDRQIQPVKYGAKVRVLPEVEGTAGGGFCDLPALFQGDEGVAGRTKHLQNMLKNLLKPLMRKMDQGTYKDKRIERQAREIMGLKIGLHDRAAGMGAGQCGERWRPVEPHGVESPFPEPAHVPTGPAAYVEDGCARGEPLGQGFKERCGIDPEG